MKKYILLSLMTFPSVFAWAVQKNPQIRTCHTLGGEFVVASSYNDQIGFCRFGKALVGALDLTLFNNKETVPQSLSSYIKNQTSCEPMGRIETLTVLGGSESIPFCAYNDGSFIELGTLIKGSGSLDNNKLNKALGLSSFL